MEQQPDDITVIDDSDDDLEDIDKYIGEKDNDDDLGASSLNTSENFSNPPINSAALTNRLESLVLEIKSEEKKSNDLHEIKQSLLNDISNKTYEDSYFNDDKHKLATEHADHICKLEVKPSQLKKIHPGLLVFHQEKFCCLLTQSVKPVTFGYQLGSSALDKAIMSSNLNSLLLSKLLVVSASKVTSLDSILLWLWNLMSIHTSPITVESCHHNLKLIIQQLQVHKMSEAGRHKAVWCPRPMDLLRLLVNLGADAEDVLGEQSVYSAVDVSAALSKDASKSDEPIQYCSQIIKNFGKVLDVLTLFVQMRPPLTKEDLTLMFLMLAKTSLDISFQSLSCHEFLRCLSSILECYTLSEWPSVAIELCMKLSKLTDDHHNQCYLTELLQSSARGCYLKSRLCYLFLRQLLIADEVQIEKLLDLKLSDILNLGATSENNQPALTTGLLQLVRTDLYKLSSALELLDGCVGAELHRSTQSVPDLENLISQIKVVMNETKDNMDKLDSSKVKGSINHLIVKWSMTVQNSKSKQRSIFTWMTAASHEPVQVEVLKDKKSPQWDDDDDIMDPKADS
ncbi:SMC5-SMC6 complex localization factor protein 2-like [Physella acuta]|uniref:SMC5-SMC6 complex localization factor protein 2-like n=1 Tax=Physella acuta TaxID=109671 RepID=UPI0027DE270A|nr:SMC5-SMC6 complex localization factor protein 2-like [Physella acuta]